MALPINIDDLLYKHKIESDRIEFKKGWNALYHRNYQEREPVEITIEPDKISILSYSGPDRSISIQAIREAKSLRSRRYRNRRLGEFLKELGLTEGRATGIPTIQKVLAENGSPKAIIETDDCRLFFLIDILCHQDFIGDAPVDALVNAPVNAPVDVQVDNTDNQQIANDLDKKCPSQQTNVQVDAPVDAPVNAPVDAPVDALVDAPVDVIVNVIVNVIVDNTDIQQIAINLVKKCPKNIQEMSKLYPNNVQIVALLEKLAICLSRCTIEISGQEMTRDIDPTTYKHKKRKYLDKLLEMNLIRMTNPDNPTAHTQRYICTELGREIIGK